MSDFGISEIAAIASIAGTGASALGAIGAGQAQAAQARYSAQVAANNQTIANQNAAYAVRAGEQDAAKAGMKQRAQQGALRAAIAAHGVDVNTGSASDVQQGEAETGQLDAETTRSNAGLRAYGYRTQATSFDAESRLQKAAAGFDEQAGFLKAGGTLLAGASSFGGGKWDSLFKSAKSNTGEFGDWSPMS